MWLNRSIATINATLQLLDIYIYIDIDIDVYIFFVSIFLKCVYFLINCKCVRNKGC